MKGEPQTRVGEGTGAEAAPSLLQGKHITTLIAVFVLGLAGYALAPNDLAMGSYTAQIAITLDDQVLSAEFPFTVGEEVVEPVIVSVEEEGYRLIVEGKNAVPYRLGEQIAYKVQVTDPEGAPVMLASDSVTSTLIGPGYQQTLSPTDRADEWLIFSMRLPFKAKITAGLLFAVAVLWITELVPLSAAALLIPIVIVLGGVTDAETVLQPFSHPIIMLFLASFLIAEGMHRTGVDRRIALTILRLSSLKPAYLMLTMMALTAFLSMWMSNTASVAIILPIALAILSKIPGGAGRAGFRQALILGVAYAGSMGGLGSAIGTPPNILAITFLNDFTAANLTFNDWFAFGLPMTLIMVPIIWVYLTLTFRVKFGRVGEHISREIYEEELREMGAPDRRQWTVIAVFVLAVALWLTESVHNIPTAIVALGGAFALFFTGTIKREDLGHINWDALLTFGGGLAIGSMLVATGVSDWIALQLTCLAGQPPVVVLFLVALLTLVVGAFISNTACAAMLIPLSIPLAQILGIDPHLLVAVVAISSSIDFALVIGTPPTMIAYSTGFFKTQEIFRRGIILDLIGVLILSFGVIWIWQLLGVVTI
jgi:sodium-dependent dicarboxylate transporter 2/3/5